MLRWICCCVTAIFGLSGVASAASISAVLTPTFADSSGGITLSGLVQQKSTLVTTEFFIAPLLAPNSENIAFKEVVDFASDGYAAVRTTYTQQTNGSNRAFFLTTYAWFQKASSTTIVSAEYYVQHQAYLEFNVVGNYSWEITRSDPLANLGLSPTNSREFRFVKVVGGVEGSPIASHTDGATASSTIFSTIDIGSGIYRLHYNHTDDFQFDPGKDNATNLNIAFTFKSEDGNGGGGGGGVVPEPSSVAVFGLLSLGGAVAKWRRKKLQPAA